MKRMLLITPFLFLLGLAVSQLTGCESTQALGTHRMAVQADGSVEIDSRTVRGAPDIDIERPDGTQIHIQSGSVDERTRALIDLLLQ